ncbi:hypothetical protein STRTUCAR8_04143 [Streptomyces turgidiscabies Car8]|uniref:Uncharacterized protein n=1 Tax=Streptomyces turgidiscabies (strain Car8) TaxID=698760 RepID=L7F6X3_STRT8|nr:hypothetical protein STRTUCAR8_01324 [Streptomyces turgidiscabies Car8]ELP66410.1 hypothetical protein STRTUCAR8_04143 [Streptomyces turgidiscabies Car8]
MADSHRLTRVEFLEQAPSGLKSGSPMLRLVSPYGDSNRRQRQYH